MTTVLVLVATLLISSNASAGVTDLRLKVDQIFDVQWNIRNGSLNASGFNYIYSSVNYDTQTNSARRWTAAQTADAGSNDRYIGFFDSTTNPGTYGMAVFNSDGSVYKLINNTGTFRALADGAIFYNGNGMWGTLITTEAGYSLGSSGSWSVTESYPTNADLDAYVAPAYSSDQAAPPPPPTCGGSSDSSVTCDQATKSDLQYYDNHAGRKSDWEDIDTGTENIVRIEQIGDNNILEIDQTMGWTGGGNLVMGRSTTDDTATITGEYNDVDLYQYGNDNVIGLDVAGDDNRVNGLQSGNGMRMRLIVEGDDNFASAMQYGNSSREQGQGHFADIKQSGDDNLVSTYQWDESQLLVVDVEADNTMVLVDQRDGENYASVVVGSDHTTVDLDQRGGGDHGANINFTGSSNSDLTLIQDSATSQIIDVTQNCGTLGGCSPISITQN